MIAERTKDPSQIRRTATFLLTVFQCYKNQKNMRFFIICVRHGSQLSAFMIAPITELKGLERKQTRKPKTEQAFHTPGFCTQLLNTSQEDEGDEAPEIPLFECGNRDCQSSCSRFSEHHLPSSISFALATTHPQPPRLPPALVPRFSLAMSLSTQLISISDLPQKDRLPAYTSLLPSLYESPLPGLSELVDHIVNDSSVSLVVGRQIYAEIVGALSEGKVKENKGQEGRDKQAIIKGILRRVGQNAGNYEEQVSRWYPYMPRSQPLFSQTTLCPAVVM